MGIHNDNVQEYDTDFILQGLNPKNINFFLLMEQGGRRESSIRKLVRKKTCQLYSVNLITWTHVSNATQNAQMRQKMLSCRRHSFDKDFLEAKMFMQNSFSLFHHYCCLTKGFPKKGHFLWVLCIWTMVSAPGVKGL